MPSSMSSNISSDNEQSELPFNSTNKILPNEKIKSLLNTYGVQETPRNYSLYRCAMVHKSYCTRKNENAISGNTECPPSTLPLQEESNERLEFLGDSVLNISVASYIFERYPSENEGFLTKMRTKLVNGKMLAKLSALVGLPDYIIISKQIEDNDGRHNSNILEDAFEAFLGAIYLDLGFEAASTWVIGVIEYNVDFAELLVQNTNYKDQFLKQYQQLYGYLPRFLEIDVDKHFTICIKDNSNKVLSVGKGQNKKEAENEAAKKALANLSLLAIK